MKQFSANIGKKSRLLFEDVMEISAFSIYSFRAIIHYYRRGILSTLSVIMKQIKFTGLDALPFTMMIALILGSLVIIQAIPQLSLLGASEMIGNILVIAVIRELGPLLTAIVVIARSGTAISAELGNSVVLREIEALEAMGINPFHYTIVPRIIASVVSVFCLTIYFDITAIFGGYLIASTRLVLPFQSFINNVIGALTPYDIYLSIAKSLLFGFLIAIVCCYYGLKVHRSPTEVPQAVTKGVITALFLVFVTSFSISYIIYLV